MEQERGRGGSRAGVDKLCSCSNDGLVIMMPLKGVSCSSIQFDTTATGFHTGGGGGGGGAEEVGHT